MFIPQSVVLKRIYGDSGSRYPYWHIIASVTKSRTFIYTVASYEDEGYFLINESGVFAEFFLDTKFIVVPNDAPAFAKEVENAIHQFGMFAGSINKQSELPLARLTFLQQHFSVGQENSAITETDIVLPEYKVYTTGEDGRHVIAIEDITPRLDFDSGGNDSVGGEVSP